MASCSLFLFFTTLVILLSTQTHARDSYFFGKFHRDSSKDQNPLETTEKTTLDESLPNKKDQEQEQDLTFVPESENGYGLYGHETTYNNKEDFNNDNKKYNEKVNGHESFSTPSLSEKEETTYNNYEEKYPRKTNSYDNNGYYNNEEEFNNNNKKFDEKVNGHETFSTPSLREKEESTYNNYDENYAPKKTYNGYYNNNEEEFNGDNKYDERAKEEESKYYNTNAYYGTELEREAPYKGYNDEHNNLERQGMSDTRFMEKGNYYYDLYNDKNHGHYYKKPHRKSPAGYYTSPATTENSFDQSYSYGNKNNEEEEEKGFKDPYNATWEKNVMDVEQGDQFKP
ncbi:unnamed protein product [Cochlearia groenlandica]